MTEPVNILVVDDDELDRAAVRRALRTSGLAIRLIEADDGRSALAALRESSVDCVLLDYWLPGTDGLTLLRTVRSEGIRTPIIIMTGQGDEQIAVDIMKAGATDYLAKGRLSPEVLSRSIRHALRIYQAETQAAEAENERKATAAALRRNERLLSITLRSIGDALIATDDQGRVTFMNALAESLTGWSAQEAESQPVDRVLPLVNAATGAPLPSPAASVLDTGITIEIDGGVLAQNRNGHRFPVVSNSAPIRDDDGAVVGTVVVLRDITDRVRNEERLLFLAEMSRLLSSSLDYQAHLKSLTTLAVPRFADYCAIDTTTPDGTIQRVAFAAVDDVFQASSVDLRHRSIDPRNAYGPARVIATAQTDFQPDLMANLIEHLSDEQRMILSQIRMTSYISVPLIVRGELLGAITFARIADSPAYTGDDVVFAEEIARRTALAVDNAVLYHEAQQAIQARDAFLSVASHELKTPLTTLLGYADLLTRRIKRGTNTQIEQRDHRVLQIMNDQAHRLNKMVNALFDLSRLQMGQLAIEREPVDVGSLATRIAKDIEPILERHTLHAELGHGSLVIRGDELRLEQVIQNLVHNAIKYSPDGGPIWMRVHRQTEWVQISVQDHGLGIPSESLQRIFRRFYRATNTESHHISGMGVGLYVAKQIVDLHGGYVEVESTEGRGSTFVVWLPAAPADESSPAISQPIAERS